ncbi:hypothetical protein BDV37DRAFT_112131 [Aspergillus pseudonomiae]|uniref:Uncharacterized protein n=1 Tax=Aspergillus pseudonomiae TaxID=1506151 RepID=A0A5N7DV16_9EURO|nr:uncharacterized protein BDV37DRAFT_112131 [Aspergillus pseudonomiae]KAE8409358.1 hypothetical protein BDV37DRAFT_112131 [Aspergillus pseudonomiae]
MYGVPKVDPQAQGGVDRPNGVCCYSLLAPLLVGFCIWIGKNTPLHFLSLFFLVLFFCFLCFSFFCFLFSCLPPSFFLAGMLFPPLPTTTHNNAIFRPDGIYPD